MPLPRQHVPTIVYRGTVASVVWQQAPPPPRLVRRSEHDSLIDLADM
jgi:hypothetical protein